MAMTRKDFQIVAAGIQQAKEAELRRHAHNMEALDAVTDTLAAMFALQYDSFKASTFKDATNPKPSTDGIQDDPF